MKKVVVIGGAGNVGSGVAKAFKKCGWRVIVIDPKVNRTFEDFTNSELNKFLKNVDHVVYVAEDGNRDNYVKNPNLQKENNKRFNHFVNKLTKISPTTTIWYIGGSWTKRKPNNNWIVNDRSPNKPLSECNPYEKAKISAEKNAETLSNKINVRFLDWASIVPNLSPNFSIPKMVEQAINDRVITYSPGPYGRPLLESEQAGEALIILIENDHNNPFEKHLIPGIFISFEEFAKTVKSVIEKETGKKILREKQARTPDFLKTKTYSKQLMSFGFKPNKKRVQDALRKNAKLYLKSITK